MRMNKSCRSVLYSFACLLLAAFCCLLSACATSGDVDQIKQDVDRLQRESAATKTELESLKEKTAGVAKEESFNTVRMNQAEIQSQLTNAVKDIQVLSGRFDENKYFIEKTLKDWTSEMDLMKAQITAMESRLKEMKNKLTAFETQSQQPGEPSKEQETEKKVEEPKKEAPPKEEKTSVRAPSGKREKYEAAYAAFKNKRYKESREKFESFIKEFPKDELTDNAYFWIAEAFYADKDLEGAILSYETFLKKYPNSKKAPAALLKQGRSFLGIGDKKTGKVILEQLIERFPKSKEAEMAKKDLEDLNKKPAKKKKK